MAAGRSATLAELCLDGKQKIPFTCSYLPGKTNFRLTFWLCIGLLMNLVSKTAELERHALDDTRLFAGSLITLCIAGIAIRWRTTCQAKDEDTGVQFEDADSPVITGLGLHRDGALVVEK
jgi:hypothetical protein